MPTEFGDDPSNQASDEGAEVAHQSHQTEISPYSSRPVPSASSRLPLGFLDLDFASPILLFRNAGQLPRVVAGAGQDE
jgi:hypothetical protein